MLKQIYEIIKKHPQLTAWLSTLWNILYGLLQLYLAIKQKSYWYLTMAAFFLTLGMSRLLLISIKGNEKLKMRILASTLFFLAVVISGTTYLTITETINPLQNMILVIGQAAWVFGILIAAICNTIISYKKKDKTAVMIRNLSLASALGSILSLERTMLGTFGKAGDQLNVWLEALSGLLVFTVLIILGYQLLKYAEAE